MPRVYSQGKVEAARLADGDVLNTNYKLALETLNGQLDAHNVPIRGFDQSSLADSTTSVTSTYQSSYGTINSFYCAIGRGAAVSYSEVDAGWQRIEIDSAPVEYLEVTTTEPACVVVGAALVSGQRLGKTDATTSARFGEDSSWELGVFVDGNLIAETGEIPAGIYTPHLPFSTQLSAGVHVIEARWKQNLTRVSALNDHDAFQTLSAHLWVRCQKR
jgi:hypothetical protein